MAEKCIELKGITKAFDGQIVLDHMNLDIHENEFVTLLGPSGCGKTTTLRIMGGFETADEGQVLLNGTDIARLPANKRPINTVFQKYALFSHMNIEENIAFGLKIKKKYTRQDQICAKAGKSRWLRKTYAGFPQWRPAAAYRDRACHRK